MGRGWDPDVRHDSLKSLEAGLYACLDWSFMAMASWGRPFSPGHVSVGAGLHEGSQLGDGTSVLHQRNCSGLGRMFTCLV